MTILTIFLGIIVLLLILFVILYYLNKGSGSGILDLKTSVPPITPDNISKPTSPNYYYSTWVYVNIWDSSPKTLFTYDRQSLTLGSTTQELKFNYTINNDPNTNANKKHVVITSTFPIQKWAHVAISKSGNVLDFYLDGKLIKSYQSEASLDQATAGSSITFGNDSVAKNDIFLAKFQRSPSALNPRSAWNMYLLGPGTGVPMGSDYNYNITMSVTKDSIVQKTYKLF
jgi:hypothetical protein